MAAFAAVVLLSVGLVGFVPTSSALAASDLETPEGRALAAVDATPDVEVVFDADPDAVATSNRPIGPMPTKGNDYLAISTGNATAAIEGTNPDDFLSSDLANETGTDRTVLTFTVSPPAGAVCLGVDFTFGSEEYPEYVGSSYNDVFTIENGDSDISVGDNNEIVAPKNQAFDTQGNVISINSVFGMAPLAGQPLDGYTPLLAAAIPLVVNGAGKAKVVVTIQDIGDSAYDSVVLLDNFRYLYGLDCKAGAVEAADSDGDGLPDEWETNGIDVDNNGTIDVPLQLMGADPNKPDIFVEVDWMVRPAQKFLWYESKAAVSFAPTGDAIKKVVDSFGQQGINLHVDAGPSSTDYVTGKKWGSLSRGSEVAYRADLGKSNGDTFVWDTGSLYDFQDYRNDNFSTARNVAFRYALFVEQYGGKNSSGIARAQGFDVVDEGSPAFAAGGQDFIIAAGRFERTTSAVAGTFMHELGHTLGLGHGGGDHRNYKPNYLSIMNYSFQFSGLEGSNKIDYSRWQLPTIDESSLLETRGVDPDGLTAGSGVGTQWTCPPGWFGSLGERTSSSVTHASLDFDCDGQTDSSSVKVDISRGQKKYAESFSTLAGFEDWGHLVFAGGGIGALGAEAPAPTETEVNELTLEEALAADVLGNPGAGALDVLGPFTVVAGKPDQSLFVNVSNLSSVAASYSVSATGSLLEAPFSKEVDVSGSVAPNIAATELEIPFVSFPTPGTYEVVITLKAPGRDDESVAVSIEVADPSADEKTALLDAVNAGELDVPPSVEVQLKSILAEASATPSPTPTTTPTPTPSPTTPATGESTAEITLATSTVAQGGTVRITGEGFAPGEQLTIWLHSTPVKLATVAADAAGSFTNQVTIPAETSLGSHSIVVSGTDRSASAAIVVTAASTRLGATGSEVPFVAAMSGIAALLLGVGLLMSRLIARRRTSD